MIRRSFDPGRPSAAAATECSVNGPWKLAQAVSASPRQSAITPKHSTGVPVQRGNVEAPAHDDVGSLERRHRRRRRRRSARESGAPRRRAGRSRRRRARPRPPRDTETPRRRRQPARPRNARSRTRPRSTARRSRRPPGTAATSPRRPSPVRTPSTPGSSSAAVASIDSIRACANGERTIAACCACGTGSMSSMKRPSPRSSASSSKRGRAPAHPRLGRDLHAFARFRAASRISSSLSSPAASARKAVEHGARVVRVPLRGERQAARGTRRHSAGTATRAGSSGGQLRRRERAAATRRRWSSRGCRQAWAPSGT